VELHTSSPKLVNKMLEDESIVKDVSLGENGLPEIEEKFMGIIRVETSRLIYDNAKPGDKVEIGESKQKAGASASAPASDPDGGDQESSSKTT
jgi:hypothetical protein